jgi:hypothetical protein
MHRIWAVATNTVKQALRMKIAAVFIVLLIVLLPVMGISMTGDGTLKGRLQTFVSYGLSLTNLLLCLLTIIVSIYTLTSDIKQRQIYTIITKPIRRYQLLLGKLLGVMLLNTALLLFFSAIIYTITIYTPKIYDAKEADIIQVKNEFYTARAALVPPEIDVTKEVEDAYSKLQESGQLPPNVRRSTIIAELTNRKQLEKRAAVVGQPLVWEFHNVKVLDPNGSLFVRFKYETAINPPDLQIYSRWDVGDSRQYPAAFNTYLRKDPIRTFREMEVPANLIADDGYLAIRFLNVPLNDTTIIFPPDGLEVLYKAGTFTTNFIRAVLLILFRLIFLASLSLLAASFLSFPVAVLLSLCIFVTATFSGFCLESFDFLGSNLSWFYSYTVRPIILLLPQFDKFNPTKFLVPARLLSWSLLAEAAGLMVCIKALLLLVFALLVFRYREIAKIII